MVAGIFAFVYCIGIPCLAYGAARANHTKRGRRRRQVLMLLSSYKREFWWFESLDLVRKCLLTSVVLIVDPDSLLQVRTL